MKSCVWFRQDLRLKNNLALHAALESSNTIVLLYILDDRKNDHCLGSASKWWLHHSLLALSKTIEERGAKLILRKGNPLEIIPTFLKENSIQTLYWNRHYEPSAIIDEDSLTKILQEMNIKVCSFSGNLLLEPWEIKNKQEGLYKVFTPFSHALEYKISLKPLLLAPKRLPMDTDKKYETEDIFDWCLCPTHPNWAVGFEEHWKPGELNAGLHLHSFLENQLEFYASKRDYPGEIGTSHLSPYLHFGEISIREIFQSVLQLKEQANNKEKYSEGASVFIKELFWREFAYYSLYHHPDSCKNALRQEFNVFPWSYNRAHYKAWQKGLTGYPIVDAGMRELYHIGWMHNRVRMITASLLVKNLLLPWQWGAKWFLDTLVDADVANNTMGWQWVAGCGVDAAPFFRIFNPTTQGKKFDPLGKYIRKWLPELTDLDNKYIHEPWTAPQDILTKANIKLGKTYPKPIVDLKSTRERALLAFAKSKLN